MKKKNLTLLFLLIGLSSAIAQDNIDVRIMRSKNTSYQPVQLIVLDILPEIAKKKGINIKIDTQVIPSSQIGNDLMIAKKLDIIVSSLNGFANIETAMPGQIKLLTGFTSYEGWLICHDSSINSAQDFKSDTKIAMKNLRTNQEVLLKQIAKKEFSDYSALDKTIVLLPDDQIMSLMLSKDKNIQCSIPSAPSQNTMVREGLKKVYSSGTNDLEPTRIAAWARKDWLDANPKLGEAWIEAVQQAIIIYNKDKKKAIQKWIEIDNFSLDAEDVMKGNLENNQIMTASVEGFDIYINTLRAIGFIKGLDKRLDEIVWNPQIKR